MFQNWRRRSAPADPGLATEADIRMCFRLLLGREPNPEEWRGHSAQVGQELSSVVAGYVSSLEFARRTLTRTDHAADIAEHDGFRVFASPDDLLIGRHVLSGQYEPEIVALFRQFLRPGMVAVDVGANIGLFTMLAASLVGASGAILAIEPNVENVRLLEASRRLNQFAHVIVAPVAAGRGTGVLLLNTTYSNGTTSEPPDDLRALLGARVVPSLTVDNLLDGAWGGARRVDLIKIDVEGAEYNALLGAVRVIERDRPVIISEFSPGAMPGISGVSGPEYLRWLHARGYNLSVIQPNGPPLDAGQDVDAVMQEYERRATDHVDLLARPTD